MCSNGVNTGQFDMMLDQLDDQLALQRRWTHKMAHLVGDAGFAKTDDILHQVQSLLDDARALITDAKDALEDEAASGTGVTVDLV
jgi:hypothetical protein